VLVSLQEFDGSFEASERLASAIGVSVSDVSRVSGELGVSASVLATALAVLFFETKLAHLADDWQLVVAKVCDDCVWFCMHW